MNLLFRAWRVLFFHSDKRYFDLPITEYELPKPHHEVPFGTSLPRAQTWFTRITRGGSHGTPGFYVVIGLILSVITMVEVWIFTIDTLGGWFVPLLLVLSGFKFILVVGFYMHLRFDHRLFTIVFTTGFILSIIIFILLLVLFGKLAG